MDRGPARSARSAFVVVLSSLVLGGALGWFARGSGPAVPIVTDSPPPPARDVARPALAASAPIVASLPDASVSSARSSEGAPPPTGAPAAAFPQVHVRVVDAAGEPSWGVAYALPAGHSAGSRPEDVPRAEVEDGRCTLNVPSEGLYDIGCVQAPAAWALERDVLVPGTNEVVLRMPPMAMIQVDVGPVLAARIRAAASAERRDGDRTVALTATRVDPRPPAPFPGRDERLAERVDRLVFQADPRWKPGWWLPAGTYRVEAAAPFALAVDPSTLSPPGTVAVEAKGATVHVTPRLAPHDRSFADARVLSVEFRAEGNPSRWFASVPAGKPLESLVHYPPAVLRVPAERGVVEWSGSGVVPGSAPYQAAADGLARIDVVLSVGEPPQSGDASLQARAGPPEPEPPERTLTIGVSGEGEAPRHVRAATDRGTDVGFGWEDEARRGTGSVEGEEWTSLVAIGEPDWASAPVERRSGGPIDVAMRRGGFVLVVPDRIAPAGLVVTVERADGAPFRSRSIEERDAFAARPVKVLPGIVLGPLEPGPVGLRFRVAGRVFEETTVEVRAGEHVPLVVRVRPPR